MLSRPSSAHVLEKSAVGRLEPSTQVAWVDGLRIGLQDRDDQITSRPLERSSKPRRTTQNAPKPLKNHPKSPESLEKNPRKHHINLMNLPILDNSGFPADVGRAIGWWRPTRIGRHLVKHLGLHLIGRLAAKSPPSPPFRPHSRPFEAFLRPSGSPPAPESHRSPS